MRLLRFAPPAEQSRRGSSEQPAEHAGPNRSFSSPMVVAQARCEMPAFTIQASKNGQTITTVRIRPTVCVEKAKTLLQEGWQVHITNAAGHQYGSDEIDQLAAELQSSEIARS
jgi:hypothetical protein